jgi:rare lipoprotein A
MRMMLPCWLLLALGACAAPRVPPAAPEAQVQAAPPVACVQDGVASWYAPHRGQARMADGHRLNPAALTAAHRFLPFGTIVRVTDLMTGRSVDVRITDRGPIPRDRIIDVTPAAARALAMRRAGTAPVRLEIDRASDARCLLREAAW